MPLAKESFKIRELQKEDKILKFQKVTHLTSQS